MAASRVFAAVDLGASSGRVVAGVVDDSGLRLEPIRRFTNRPRPIGGRLCWDFDALCREVERGLGELAAAYPQVESIGIDTWAVDYGLLDDAGELLCAPTCYRDPQVAAAVGAVHEVVDPEELFAINGLQFLPFTTMYQLSAERGGSRWDRAKSVVLLPDLLAFRLTGELRTEATNASTTGLVDVRTGAWSTELMERLGLPRERFAPIEAPGVVRGTIRAELATRLGLDPATVVTTVGSHDTASAVVGLPTTRDDFAYVSCGTWSLVGLELDAPQLGSAAREAAFTNEAGVDGRIRFLRNVGGLWLVEESLRTWAAEGRPLELPDLLAAAEILPPDGPRIDPDDPAYFAPGDLPARISAAVTAVGGRAPAAPPEVLRCIIDSLAEAFAGTVGTAAALAHREVAVIHLVGGGAHNALLCQRTADAAECPVVAGPAEATVVGNLAVQARAHGAAPESLEDLRVWAARGAPRRYFEPSVSR